MKLPNWRYAALFTLMAVGLIATGADTDSERAFYILKAVGLSCLWALGYLTGRWQREGKIKGFTTIPSSPDEEK